MKPKITIIIPCYNSEKWIEQCVMSCLCQTYENVEVIAVDNESRDNTVKILNDIKKENPELILSSAENIYPNCWDEAREEGFRLMTGDYVMTIGSDDYIDLEYVDNCMEIILSAPDKIKALQTPIQGVRQYGDKFSSTGTIQHSYGSREQFKELCLTKCPVNTPSIIYNAELYHKGLLNTKPEKYGGAADYDLYCSLIDNGIFIYPVPKWLGFYYRWHPEQATWNVHKEERNYDREIQEYWKKRWQM